MKKKEIHLGILVGLAESMARDLGYSDLMTAMKEWEDLTCEHEWEVRHVGGHPATEDSLERITVCKKCGCEELK